MKKLTQEVFSLSDCPDWANSVGLDYDGEAYWMEINAKRFLEICENPREFVGDYGDRFLSLGKVFSFGDDGECRAIDRERS